MRSFRTRKKMRNQSGKSGFVILTLIAVILRYWIKVYDLAEPVRDAAHPGYVAHVFVDAGSNCNTMSRRFFDEFVANGLVAEFIKGPETGVRINLVGGQNLMISGHKIGKLMWPLTRRSRLPFNTSSY